MSSFYLVHFHSIYHSPSSLISGIRSSSQTYKKSTIMDSASVLLKRISILFLIFFLLEKSIAENLLCVSETSGNKIGSENEDSSESQLSENSNATLSIPMPRCVTPLENLLDGRFRMGISNGGFQTTSPPWLNASLATIGQEFTKKYAFSLNIGGTIASLLAAMRKDVSKVLYSSGGIVTMEHAVKRFVGNLLQLAHWVQADLFSTQAQSTLYQSFTKVKTMHIVMSENQIKKKNLITPKYKINTEIWDAIEVDLKNSGIKVKPINPKLLKESKHPINQFGMASTLWGILATPFIRPTEYGIPISEVTDEELEGFLHFWAFVGYSIGLEDEFNIGLQSTVQNAREYYERFLQEFLIPELLDLSYEAKVVIDNSIKSFTEAVGPLAQFDFMMQRILEDYVGIPCPTLNSRMSEMGKNLERTWKKLTVPGLRSEKFRVIALRIYTGYLENISKKVFGFDGTNATIVAEHAYSF